MANDSVAKLKKLQAEAQALLDEKGIERQDESQLSSGYKFLHFWVMVGKSFLRNRCPVRASALAYTTLLALIPLLAVSISVATIILKKDGAEGQKQILGLIDKLVANVAPALNLEEKAGDTAAPVGRDKVAQEIYDYIGNIRTGTIGATSMIALVFVAISLLRTIEATFNDIWGVTRGRNWFWSTVLYWATITLGPMVLLLALGLTTGPHLTATQRWLENTPWLGAFLFSALPFVVLSLAFGAFYALIPNTRVQWQAALVGGIVGGCLWQFNNLFNVIYVSRVVTYSKIYGSLGAVPLFLIGLYFSWLILLFGAQVAYAFQNRQTYVQEKQAESVNQRGREFVALRLMTHLGQRFQRGESAPTATAMAQALGVPTRLASQILQLLVQGKLLVEALGPEPGYTPSRPLAQITGHDILHALRAGQGQELETRDEPARARVRDEFQKIQNAEQLAASALTLEALVHQADGDPQAAPRPGV